ncbi:MAG: PTS sugar transporter subunit IIC/EAL domain-containing protein [Rhodanobacteraceae bacterium]|nr:PTS sugar transporter subunit IIC/EAL domain-containing protein [Rhodanobacteraceae bacterium]
MAIRSGFLSLLPLLIIQGVALALASTSASLLVDSAELPPLVAFLYALHNFIITLMPTLAVITIAYHAANLYGTHRGYAAVFTLMVYLLMVFGVTQEPVNLVGETSLASNLFCLLLGPLVPWLFARVSGIGAMQLFRGGHYNPSIRRMLNSMLPTLLILALFVALGALFTTSLPALRTWMPSGDSTWMDTLPGLLACEFGINLLWAMGVHGSVALTPWVQALHSSGQANLIAAQQGLAMPHVGTNVFFDAFVHMGGSGMTMGLIIAVLLYARSRNKRLISYSALPIALFNVNEIVLYGLPVIFNRFLILPFVLAPLVATTTTWLALTWEWVPVPTQATGWTTPPLLGAFFATGGDWRAVALAGLNLVLSVLVYRPFLLRWEQTEQSLGQRIAEFREQFAEATGGEKVHLDDSREHDVLAPSGNDLELDMTLERLRRGRLELHYQPIIDLRSGRPVAVEALLRLNDPECGLRPPTFLRLLHAAGLMPEIDRWVIDRLMSDWREWNVAEHPLPILHVNVSPDSLLRQPYVARLVEASQVLPIVIEVVEDHLPSDIDRFVATVKHLQRSGVKLAIDDFGVGYSSLSRIAQLGISHIKLDKSLLDGVDCSVTGSQLFVAVIALAKRLELSVCVEGVERIDQLALLLEQDVDNIQGYIAGHPAPWTQMRGIFLRERPLLDIVARRMPQ